MNRGKSKEKMAELKQLDHYIFADFKGFPSQSSIVIFASTIGELRAAYQFINYLTYKYPQHGLILIPGQPQYAQVFSKVYPDTMVLHEFPSYPSLVDQFFDKTHVLYCFFIEGPSLHGFFPLRQDLSLAAGCLRHKVPLFVVNACLYEKAIASRFDQVEHTFFSNLMREAILHWYVPNSLIQQSFLEQGVPEHKLLVTGDIKLDNVFAEPLVPISSDLSDVFEFYQKHKTRLIVAGSVNEFDEQTALVRAWLMVRQTLPNVVLVLVPRYINNQVMMERLYRFLVDHDIPYIRRSQGTEVLEADKLLIIDVFGELPYFYEYSDIAFAGRGHGVLEPMKFYKPVVVGPSNTWEVVGSTAYHLFEQFLAKDALIECEDYDKLGDLFTVLLNDPEYGNAYIEKYTQFIKEQMGASERIIEHISNF